jgi:hypothetical protein
VNTLECRICLSPDWSEGQICFALARALPALAWSDGDSSWDKIRVSGNAPNGDSIRVYRYEGPGPFLLTIHTAGNADPLLAAVLAALDATVWKPLEPQPVPLRRPFPAAYRFTCERSLRDIQTLLENADFWYWERKRDHQTHDRLEGRVPGHPGQSVRISGEPPAFLIEVGHWPGSDEIHTAVQNTILPALGATAIRPA